MTVQISLDNITICGSPSDYVLKNIEKNPLVLEGWTTPGKLYHYNFPLVGGGYLQIKHFSDWYKSRRVKCRKCDGSGYKTKKCKHGKHFCRECHGSFRPQGEKCDKCNGTGGKIVVNENGIRIEFNPNNYKSTSQQMAIMDLLKNCYNPHVTRRDVAFDFFEENLNDYIILDSLSRKKRIYFNRKGLFETVYIGDSQSDLQIRIYNKAVEQAKKLGKDEENTNSIWWRVEAQMRKEYADTFFFNPFTSLKIKRKMDFSKYDLKTKAILTYLVEHPEAFNELSKPSKLKYKKMLMEDVESVELKIADMYNENAQALYEELESWISYSKHSNRFHKNSMSKPDTILKSDIKHLREIIPLENGLWREMKGV